MQANGLSMGDGSDASNGDGKDLNEKRATNAGHARRSPDDGKAAKLKFSKTHNGERQRQLNLKVEAWATSTGMGVGMGVGVGVR